MKLSVELHGQLVGTLAQDVRGQIWFEYAPTWLTHGFALSPMPSFALKPGAFKASNLNFQGLHGVFNDALPDGWGLLLMDRVLQRNLGWATHQITPLHRLAYMGNRAMGALEFKPVLENTPTSVAAPSLPQLAEDAVLVQEGIASDVLSALHIHGGSPGGARPKVTVAIHHLDPSQLLSGFDVLPEHFEHWIVKFRTHTNDPVCMGRIELAYARMAQAAGIDMPPTQLITTQVRGEQEDFFAVKRFDRIHNQKRHVISLGGMLDASHRDPCLDYIELLKAVHHATKNHQDVLRAFKLMVFNVLAHNKDDHVKNFAFIHNGQSWELSPAFDLTFSQGMNNQHTTAIAGQGNPNLQAIEKVAQSAGIKHWRDLVHDIFNVVAQWPHFAQEQGIPTNIASSYFRAIEQGRCYADCMSKTQNHHI